MRLLEPQERKWLVEASKEFNLGALVCSLQDCGLPHLLWEVCCRSASTLTDVCRRHGIQALRKTSDAGYDIQSSSIVATLAAELLRERPHRSWWSLKCLEWPSTHRSWQQPEALRKKRVKARAGIRNAVSVIEKALEVLEDHKFYWEWPMDAPAAWQTAEMRHFVSKMQAKGVRLFWTAVHGCRFGMKSPEGEYIRKAWWILSNDPDFDYRCNFQCDGMHHHHKGSVDAGTCYYPESMCEAIAKVWKSQWEQAKRGWNESNVHESLQTLAADTEVIFALDGSEDGSPVRRNSRHTRCCIGSTRQQDIQPMLLWHDCAETAKLLTGWSRWRWS